MGSLARYAVEVFKEIVSSRVNIGACPYDYQRRVFSAFEGLAYGDKALVIVRAPPGRGKTEAVVAPYLTQHVYGDIAIPRLVYATPTQTLLYSMESRFNGYLDALAYRLGRYRDALKPVPEHGLDIDPEYLIPRLTVSTYDVVAYAWMARRTIPWRPFTTRGAMFSSLIVFDEAHLVQDVHSYSQRVFRELARTIAECGVPTVVMSATLPRSFEEELRDKLGSMLELVKDEDAQMPGSLEVNLVEGRGIISEEGASRIVLERVEEALREGLDVLLVFNTVRTAVRFYEMIVERLSQKRKVIEVSSVEEIGKALSSSGIVLAVLVHGRLPIGVRKSRERVFEELRRLKIGGSRKEWSLIAVATQVAEVGLDYSFDVVVTEVAPPSAIAQRVTRGGRIRGQRSRAVVLPQIGLEEGGAGVYLPETLELGWEVARQLGRNPSLLMDVDYLSCVVDREFRVLEEGAKEWVKQRLENARRMLEKSKFLPPLATAAHRQTLEGFKLRLGEYVALYILRDEPRQPASSIGALLKELGDVLGQTASGWKELVDGSIRLSLKFRKQKESLTVTVPRPAIWEAGGETVLVYVGEIKRDEVILNYLRLRKVGGGAYRAEDDIEEIYGKILISRPVEGFSKEKGLVEVEWVDIIPSRRILP